MDKVLNKKQNSVTLRGMKYEEVNMFVSYYGYKITARKDLYHQRARVRKVRGC